MENNREPLSPEESLKVIQTMINRAKTSVADKSFYFLLWGWLVFIAAILQFFLKVVVHTEAHYAAWNIMFIGIIVSVLHGVREKDPSVRTFLDDGLQSIWICIGIVQTLVVFIFIRNGDWEHCYTIFILLYSIGCFLTGRMLKFAPLVWGGVSCWGLAILTTYVSADTNMLLMAAAVLISYIIPGYLLRSAHKRQLLKQP
jgi:hypothetical protein